MAITKDMLLGEIINQYPQTQEIFLKYGLHCVGCAYSPLDTVEAGCRLHGMEDDEIEALVSEVNSAASEDSNSFPEVTVQFSDAALSKTKELLHGESKKSALRISALPQGCGCSSYGMSIENEFSNDDIIMELHGTRIVMDPETAAKLESAKIDYDEAESGFVFSGIKNCCHGHVH